MSSHSKWASIKHKKGKEDAKRGQIFSKLTKAIMVAAKGGGNPEANAALATAIEKAKEYNMPADTIERAIKKGSGELGGAAIETILYEGYGPAGTAVMVETLTDNRNRTAADIRHIFSRYGANLGTSGSVSWMFEKKGVIYINKSDEIDEDELLNIALEAGADDMNIGENNYEILTEATNLKSVKDVLEANNIPCESAFITMFPKNTVKLEDKEAARKVLKFIDALEEHDDVQEVYSNFDIPDTVLEEVAAG